jgi:hypothetical protein
MSWPQEHLPGLLDVVLQSQPGQAQTYFPFFGKDWTSLPHAQRLSGPSFSLSLSFSQKQTPKLFSFSLRIFLRTSGLPQEQLPGLSELVPQGQVGPQPQTYL